MSKNQDWFNGQYSGKEKINIVKSNKLKLKGFLKIEDFTKLKSIILKNFELTKLKISGCSQLTLVDLSELSKLTNLSVTKCPNIITLNYSTGLTDLEVSGSQLKEIGLSRLTKLTSLSVTDCQKLTGLDCSSTKLTSLKIINCPQLNKIIDKSQISGIWINESKSKTKNLYVRGYSNLSTLDCLKTGFTNLEINGCSQLNEVDLSKLPKITSLSVIDCSNLSNLDCSSTGLTSLKISGCYRLEKFDCSKLPKLTSLSAIDCLKLTKLDCSNSEITDLEVSDLIELNCSNTSIKELSLNLCPYITKLDCSNNKNLKNLDISNCFKLGSINCSNSKLTSLDISYCPELEGKNIPCVTITQKKENVKNILIVGRAGGGKSTLANVLTNTDEFKESAYAVSETKIFRKKEFKWNEINFRVVDTIGAGDTKLGLKDVLYKIADGIYAMPEGISQILYVVDGRFTEEEISTFNMIEDSILQDKINILGYVTLVRTKFENFRSTEECKKDKEKMLEENENIAKIVKKCNDVIHVDNPPIKIEENDDGDNEYISHIKINRNVRQKSRQKLLKYLEEVDPVKKNNKYFKLKTWDKLHESISKYVQNNDPQKMLEDDPELEALYNASKSCLIL
ncbi:L domain-like protein [Rhizophagus irregularis]|uniref:L domain-like protein n=1 Tax=Rhizophagus irregularis TaxID=588596 RepID=A0A2I1GUF3_9GLOM|nr:L domain-like protein [Rhizophagus irregularis]